MYISSGLRRGTGFRRLSNYGRGDFSLHTSGTGGWGFCFGVGKHFYTMYITPGSARGEPACRRLSTHGCGDFGSHTRGTEGCGYLVLVCVNSFIPCTFLPGFAGGTGLPVALYSRSRRFWTA